MKCPVCTSRIGIEIDLHSNGYADTILECGECGALWMSKFGEVTVIRKAA